MSEKGHIIAIGGGGFGRNPNHRKIEKYVLDQSGKEKPNVVFFPTASRRQGLHCQLLFLFLQTEL